MMTGGFGCSLEVSLGIVGVFVTFCPFVLLSCGGNGKRKNTIETRFDTTSSAKALAGACVPTLPSLAWSCVWRACT